MLHWVPDKVRRALDDRDRAALQELSKCLITAIQVGRYALWKREVWFRAVTLGEEDDVQDVLAALYNNQGRILRRFGESPNYRSSPDALKRYVTGVTIFTLRRKYQKRLPPQEEFLDDAAADDAWPGGGRSLDLHAAIKALSADDQALFKMICIEQLDTTEICQRLGIRADAYYARRSRLTRRLRELLTEELK